MKTFKYEQAYLGEYAALADTRAQIVHFLNAVSNQKQLHSNLSYLAGARFERAC